MKRYITRTMFLRLFIYFISVIFLLNLTMGALTYFYFKSTIQERETTQSQETLNQTKQMVENTIQEIQRMAMSISENLAVRKILVLPAGQIGYSDAQAVIGMLNEKVNSSNYLQSIYLYNEHIDKVISNAGVIDLEQFWDKEAIERLRRVPPYDSWLEPHDIPEFNGEMTKVITYALRIPEGEGADNYVIINIKMDLFYQTYIELYEHTQNDVAILNQRGGTIIYNDNSAKFAALEREFGKLQSIGSKGRLFETIDGVKMLVIFVKSDFNGWLYIKAAPAAEVFKESDLILKVVLTISLACLLAGIVLVLLMSNRYYRPIYSFVQGIAGTSGEPSAQNEKPQRTDDLSVLRTTFAKLMEENEHVREEMKRHEAILKDHFLLNLLLGRETDPAETRRLVAYYDLDLPHTGYTVLLLHLPPAEEPERLRERAHLLAFRIQIICRQFLADSGGGEIVSPDHRHIALLMPVHAEKTSEADRLAKLHASSLHERIAAEAGITVTIGIGACREPLHEIEGSYNEAREALLLEAVAGEGSIIGIWDIRADYSGTREWMDFNRKIENLKIEIKLGNLLKSMEKLTGMLLEIGDIDYYRNKQLLLSQLAYAVITAMMELNPSLKGMYEGDPYVDFNRLTNIEQIGDWLRRTMVNAVEYVKDKRENKNAELVGQVCQYIRSHYAEELTLNGAAEVASLNPQYFSKIFKEATGKTFLEYLTEIRLETAAGLLQSSEAKIYEVAEKAGFGNKTNLIRAFRKTYNMTPSDFRNRKIRADD